MRLRTSLLFLRWDLLPVPGLDAGQQQGTVFVAVLKGFFCAASTRAGVINDPKREILVGENVVPVALHFYRVLRKKIKGRRGCGVREGVTDLRRRAMVTVGPVTVGHPQWRVASPLT